MSTQIEQCQASGTTVSISLGGEISQVGFTDDSEAENFADVIWDMFLGGSGPERPFGDAVLDGYVQFGRLFPIYPYCIRGLY